MANVNVAIRITSNYRGGPGFKKAEKDVKKFRKNVGRAANSVRAFQFVLTGVAISTLSIWGKKIISVASELQLLQIRLNNVEGSAKAGAKQFKLLFETFKTAPFELDKIIDGFVRLRAAGVSTVDATNTMKSLVDAVAVFGGTTQELQRATIGFQQVAGKGVLSMEELRQQIGEAVPAAMALMSRAAGITIAEFVEKVKNGMISASDAFKFFNEESKKQFGGFAESLRFTISGALQGLKSEVRVAIGNLFNIKTDASARVAAFLKLISERVTEFITSLDQSSVDAFWNAFEGVAATIEGIVKAIAFLVGVITTLLGLSGQATGIIGGQALVGGILGTMLFGAGAGFIIAGIVGIVSALGGFEQFMQDVKEFNRTGMAEGGMIGRILDATSTAGGRRPISETDALFGLFRKSATADPYGDIFGADQISSLDGGRYDELLKEYTKGLAGRQSVQLKAGILGLGAEAAGLAEDLLKLSDRAGVQAKNFASPWLKSADRMNIALSKLNVNVSTAEENFREAAAKFKKESIDPLLLGSEEDKKRHAAALKLFNEEFGRTIDGIEHLKGFANNAAAAIKEMVRAGSAKFLDKTFESLQKLANESDLATGKRSALQVGLREIAQEAVKTKRDLDLAIVSAQNIIEHPDSTIAQKARAGVAQAGARSQQFEADRKAIAEKHNLIVLDSVRIQNLKTEVELIREISGEEIRLLKRRFDFGSKNLINDQLTNEVLATKSQLQAQILELETQIKNATAEILLTTTDEFEKASLREKVEIWREMQREIQKVKEAISEEALLEQQLWRDLGQIMENGVGNAIKGLIDGTKTLKEVMLDMWSSAIAAAAKYIVKLLIMKALGALFPGSPGITGTEFAGLLAAKGAVLKGNVKPFANGDIIRGPTMFGLAGEAGTEAIMPLKRGSDGKLGVAGGGGDNFTVNIQAIDTQTGAQFLLDNMPTIVAGMTQETALNRGMRRAV